MKKSLLVSFFCVLYLVHFAQNVSINNSGQPANASAMLDVSAPDKGVLIPRVALTSTLDVSTIPNPATSLLVYNTQTAGTAPNQVTPGFYFWNGTAWASFNQSSNSGNSGPRYVGERFGGGIIFHVYTDTNGVQRGWIVAPFLGAARNWSANTNSIPQHAWNGSGNTNAMIAITTNSSANTCRTGNYNGFNDWYLPAVGQLQALFGNVYIVNPVLNNLLPYADYWSSSQGAQQDNFAWHIHFSGGLIGQTFKTNTKNFVCIREF